MRSLGILRHITDVGKPLELVEYQEGTFSPNPKYDAWINNDDLLISWLLGVIIEEVLSLIMGVEFTYHA